MSNFRYSVKFSVAELEVILDCVSRSAVASKRVSRQAFVERLEVALAYLRRIEEGRNRVLAELEREMPLEGTQGGLGGLKKKAREEDAGKTSAP